VEIAINLLNLSYLIFAFPRALTVERSVQDAMAKGIATLSLLLPLASLLSDFPFRGEKKLPVYECGDSQCGSSRCFDVT